MNIDILELPNKPYFHIISGEEYAITDNYKIIKKQYNESFEILDIEGKQCRNKENLFTEFHKAFSFPNCFGNNWMDFDEYINDLGWLSFDGAILIIKNADMVLENKEKELEVFYGILRDTLAEWNEGRNYYDFPTPSTPFHIILVVDKENINNLKRKLEKFEIELG